MFFAKRFLACMLASAMALAGAQANDERSVRDRKAFERVIEANIHEVQFDGKLLSGKGLEWLISEGEAAQYFLVGERHGLAEIPEISAQLFEALTGKGYRFAALEIGPFAARRVNESLAKGGYERLAEYLSSREGYESAAFLSWQEEAEMAARMFAASGEPNTIWGLDQEYGGAAYGHFLHLESLATAESLKTALRTQADAALKSDFYLTDIPRGVLPQFRDAFEKEGSQEAVALLDDMILSWNVYGPWAKPERTHISKSNIMREDYMKQRFLEELRDARKAGSDPKVFFKFGGTHAAPAIETRTGRIMMGMMVENVAMMDGQTAFNILMDCYSGKNLTSGQDAGKETGAEQGCSSMFGKLDDAGSSSNIFSKWLKGRKGAFLVDLRPIRATISDYRFLTEDEKSILIGFDAFLALPNTTPSKSFPAPGKGSPVGR